MPQPPVLTLHTQKQILAFLLTPRRVPHGLALTTILLPLPLSAITTQHFSVRHLILFFALGGLATTLSPDGGYSVQTYPYYCTPSSWMLVPQGYPLPYNPLLPAGGTAHGPVYYPATALAPNLGQPDSAALNCHQNVDYQCLAAQPTVALATNPQYLLHAVPPAAIVSRTAGTFGETPYISAAGHSKDGTTGTSSLHSYPSAFASRHPHTGGVGNNPVPRTETGSPWEEEEKASLSGTDPPPQPYPAASSVSCVPANARRAPQYSSSKPRRLEQFKASETIVHPKGRRGTQRRPTFHAFNRKWDRHARYSAHFGV